MKKALSLLVVLSLFALVCYGCDTDTTTTLVGAASVCTESVSGVSSTSAAKLYYPCTISGTVGATSMSSGYTGTLSAIEWMSKAVAGAGYVVLAFTPSNTLGMDALWRDAHKACISKLISFNSTHAKLKGKINTGKLQTCGHSKGGGGSLWASSQLGSQLKTTIGLAPYEEQFSDSTLRSITAATFIEAGANDTLATNSMTRGEYSGLGNISKCYKEYTGMGHMAWASATGSNASRLSGDAIAWMKYYMDGQTSYASTISNSSGTAVYNWVK